MKKYIAFLILVLLAPVCVAQKPKKVAYIVVKYYDRKTKALRFADTIRSPKRF